MKIIGERINLRAIFKPPNGEMVLNVQRVLQAKPAVFKVMKARMDDVSGRVLGDVTRKQNGTRSRGVL